MAARRARRVSRPLSRRASHVRADPGGCEAESDPHMHMHMHMHARATPSLPGGPC
jgi:hypothetical protein